MFRDAVRDVLASECPPTVDPRGLGERAPERPPRSTPRSPRRASLGCTASEDAGGMGSTVLDTVPSLRGGRLRRSSRLHRRAAAIVIPLLEELGSDALKAEWLETARRWSGDAPRSRVRHAAFVPHAEIADLIVLVTENRSMPCPPTVKLAPQVVGRPARRVGEVARRRRDAGRRGRRRARRDRRGALRGVLATSAFLVGLARRMLDLTVEYAKVRHQFGTPIGSFQAVKHKLADASSRSSSRSRWSIAPRIRSRRTIRIERSTSRWRRATRRTRRPSSRSRRSRCHGAIGYTIECDLHLFMKRAWALSAAWGDAPAHRERIADVVLGPVPAGKETTMAEAYIVEAVRTPVGRKKGGLGGEHPADMGAHVLKALVERSRHRSDGRRGRDLRLRRHDRSSGRRHRAHVLARGRASRKKSRAPRSIVSAARRSRRCTSRRRP